MAEKEEEGFARHFAEGEDTSKYEVPASEEPGDVPAKTAAAAGSAFPLRSPERRKRPPWVQ